eukprot:2658571-Heterocapsa_arctica.AAC.1
MAYSTDQWIRRILATDPTNPTNGSDESYQWIRRILPMDPANRHVSEHMLANRRIRQTDQWIDE